MEEGELNTTNPLIGHGSRVMQRLRSEVAAAQKNVAKDMTIEYLDKSLAQTQQERFLQRSQSDKQTLQDLNAMKGTDNLAAGSGAGAARNARTGPVEMSRSMDHGKAYHDLAP
jgi:hypothetical protein